MWDLDEKEPISVLYVDDQDFHDAEIRQWAAYFSVDYTKVRTIREAEAAIADAPPTIWLVDDNFDEADEEEDRRRRGLDFVRSVIEKGLTYDSVVRLISQELANPEVQSSAKAAGIRMIPKSPPRALQRGLASAYQEALSKRASWPRKIRYDIEELHKQAPGLFANREFDHRKTVFVITPFAGEEDTALKAALLAVRNGVLEEGWFPMVADQPPSEMATVNALIRRYMHYCSAAVAIFYRRDSEQNTFNPNVALEIGYMQALGKPVLPVHFGDGTDVPADLAGIVEIRKSDPNELAEGVGKWVQKLG